MCNVKKDGQFKLLAVSLPTLSRSLWLSLPSHTHTLIPILRLCFSLCLLGESERNFFNFCRCHQTATTRARENTRRITSRTMLVFVVLVAHSCFNLFLKVIREFLSFSLFAFLSLFKCYSSRVHSLHK